MAIGYIHPGDVAGCFAASLAETLLNDRRVHRIRNSIEVQCSPRIAEGRSTVVDTFLHHTRDEWLLMIDADMAWGKDAFELLCEHADPEKVPIIGGLCFGGGRSHGPDGKLTIFPTIYRLIEENGSIGTEHEPNYERDALIKVGATGAAFLMVHRKVFIAMQKHLGKMPDGTHNPYPWFAEVVRNGRAIGEDVTFCLRAQAMGIPVHVHTGAKVRHRKSFYLDEAAFDENQQ